MSLSHHVADFNVELYGADAHSFNPDRWLTANKEQRRAMEKASTAFSAGKRMCLGMHLATIEMKKALARLVMTFEVSDRRCRIRDLLA